MIFPCHISYGDVLFGLTLFAVRLKELHDALLASAQTYSVFGTSDVGKSAAALIHAACRLISYQCKPSLPHAVILEVFGRRELLLHSIVYTYLVKLTPKISSPMRPYYVYVLIRTTSACKIPP